MVDGVILAAVAAAATAITVPIVSRIARSFGLLDCPNGRKAHPRPTPLLGGAAVLLGVVVAASIAGGPPAIVIAAALAWTVGTIDDARPDGLRASVKLVLQVAVAITWVVLRGDAGASAIDAAVVVFAMNGWNLLDNADGVCATAALPVLIGVAIALDPSPAAAGVAWGAAGATVAFLAFNRPRARIFLGDGGSHLLGFLCASLGITAARGADGGFGPIGVIALIAFLALPLVDTTLVVVTRLRRRVPIWVGDRNHLSHRLHRAGLSEFAALGCLFLGGALAAALGATLLA